MVFQNSSRREFTNGGLRKEGQQGVLMVTCDVSNRRSRCGGSGMISLRGIAATGRSAETSNTMADVLPASAIPTSPSSPGPSSPCGRYRNGPNSCFYGGNTRAIKGLRFRVLSRNLKYYGGWGKKKNMKKTYRT